MAWDGKKTEPPPERLYVCAGCRERCVYGHVLRKTNGDELRCTRHPGTLVAFEFAGARWLVHDDNACRAALTRSLAKREAAEVPA